MQAQLRKLHLGLAAMLVLSFASQESRAGEHYAIIDRFDRKPLNAFLDVAVDSRSGGGVPPEVRFNIYDTAGTEIAEFWSTTQDGFASTFSHGNLFAFASTQPFLIRARMPSAPNDGASLHVVLRGAYVNIGVLPTSKGDGTPFGMGRQFSVPLGSFRRASLLIANVSSADVGVDIHKGTGGSAGTGIYQNPRIQRHGSWRVNLAQDEALSNVIVTSTDLVVVQVMIDDGKFIQSYMVPPSQ